MGRPSLKAQRSEEILQAFEVCVSRFGVEGSSLEKIAEQAGLARALIRHNIGNRDSLIQRLIERTLKKSQDSMHALLVALPVGEPPDQSGQQLLDCLFDPEYADHQLNLVLWALIAAGNENQIIAHQMRDWATGFIAEMTQLLCRLFPDAPSTQVAAVATGITGIYFNVDALLPLGDIQTIRQQSKQAAKLLLATLCSK